MATATKATEVNRTAIIRATGDEHSVPASTESTRDAKVQELYKQVSQVNEQTAKYEAKLKPLRKAANGAFILLASSFLAGIILPIALITTSVAMPILGGALGGLLAGVLIAQAVESSLETKISNINKLVDKETNAFFEQDFEVTKNLDLTSLNITDAFEKRISKKKRHLNFELKKMKPRSTEEGIKKKSSELTKKIADMAYEKDGLVELNNKRYQNQVDKEWDDYIQEYENDMTIEANDERLAVLGREIRLARKEITELSDLLGRPEKIAENLVQVSSLQSKISVLDAMLAPKKG